jgi:hypothetical protein
VSATVTVQLGNGQYTFREKRSIFFPETKKYNIKQAFQIEE